MYLGLALLISGCSDPRPALPTSPTILPNPFPSTTPLAGIVFDSAERPLSGARVEVLDGPQAGQWTVTDGTGRYGFNGAFDDATRFRATMTGHVPAIGTRGARCGSCNPNWWLFFFLQPEGASADLTGDYTLTIVADPACAVLLPAPARERTYTVRIAHAVYPQRPPETTFTLTVDAASFLSGYGGLDVWVAGSAVTAEVGDLHGAPGLVEQVAEKTYLTFGGSISAAVTTPFQITGTFDGLIEQCELSEAWGGRRNCTSGPMVSRVSSCESVRHQLTFSRQ
jgi:hypothetical protein